MDVGDFKVWKWFKKFGRLPCVEGAGEGRTVGVAVVRGQHGEVLCVGRDILEADGVGEL